MTTNTKETKYDLKPLLNELSSHLEKGLDKVFEEFLERYTLYEDTHNSIMNIKAVKLISCQSIKDTDRNLKYVLQDNVKLQEEVSLLQGKIAEMQKRIDQLIPEEKISLEIKDSDFVKIKEEPVVSKVYEKILSPELQLGSKRALLNTMFGVSNVDTDDEIEEVTNPVKSAEFVDVQEEEEESDSDEESVADAIEDEPEEDDEEEAEEEEEEEAEEAEEEEEEAEEAEEEEEEESVANAAEEETVVEEQASVVVADAVEEEAVETEDESEEEEEVFEIEIDDVTYYTNNEESGVIYEQDKDGDPGNKVGYFKDGEPIFSSTF